MGRGFFSGSARTASRAGFSRANSRSRLSKALHASTQSPECASPSSRKAASEASLAARMEQARHQFPVNRVIFHHQDAQPATPFPNGMAGHKFRTLTGLGGLAEYLQDRLQEFRPPNRFHQVRGDALLPATRGIAALPN